MQIQMCLIVNMNQCLMMGNGLVILIAFSSVLESVSWMWSFKKQNLENSWFLLCIGASCSNANLSCSKTLLQEIGHLPIMYLLQMQFPPSLSLFILTALELCILDKSVIKLECRSFEFNTLKIIKLDGNASLSKSHTSLLWFLSHSFYNYITCILVLLHIQNRIIIH